MNNRALKSGTLVHNRYRVERVLGAGGFGVTYLVTDTRENRIAAMKEYMPLDIATRQGGSQIVLPITRSEQESYEKFRQKFLEEAQVIYRFRGHPNIIDVQHLFYENNTAYYVMEFISGMDLGKHLDQHGGRMSWSELQPIFSQVVAALEAVHQGNMIHCDISPDNICLLSSGQVKLLDFGAAKSILRGNRPGSVIFHKPGYAPPEQISSTGKLGPWTDVYALAVTIYRSCTGKMPPSAEERLFHDRTLWPSQMGFAPPSPQWEQVLKKAMALRPGERYQDVTAFWQELTGNRPNNQQSLVLEGLRGIYAGARIRVTGEMILGTDRSRCSLPMPPGTPGVSRVHLRIWPDDGQIAVMDMGSRYGTWLDNRKMTPGLVYALPSGASVYLGDGQIFRAV